MIHACRSRNPFATDIKKVPQRMRDQVGRSTRDGATNERTEPGGAVIPWQPDSRVRQLPRERRSGLRSRAEQGLDATESGCVAIGSEGLNGPGPQHRVMDHHHLETLHRNTVGQETIYMISCLVSLKNHLSGIALILDC